MDISIGQWPKRGRQICIARELCLNICRNWIIFRHICPRITIFVTNVSQTITPLSMTSEVIEGDITKVLLFFVFG